MKNFAGLVFIGLCACISLHAIANDSTETRKVKPGNLVLPQGFRSVIVAENLGRARHLVVAGNGNVYVRLARPNRERLEKELGKLSIVEQVYPSDTNFLLVKIKGADELYKYLKGKGIIVRNRSNVLLCEGSLRITVGTETENNELMKALSDF